MFEIKAENRDHYAVLRLSGDIGLADAVNFTRQMQQLLLNYNAPQYLLDLNSIRRMDNAGLGVLVSLSTQLQGRGRRFGLL
ncbi:MAG: STAS domain-containing protein, partial [Desulfovibrionaceae bacterium]|nr:STAS domain-containing protein [Desulfovibrionaceae bacterium]